MEQEADLENWARLNGYWHDDPHAYFKELGYKFLKSRLFHDPKRNQALSELRKCLIFRSLDDWT